MSEHMIPVEDSIRIRNSALEEAAEKVERGLQIFGGGVITEPSDMHTLAKAFCTILASSIRGLKSVPPEAEGAINE